MTPENRFIKWVHDHLDKDVYREKTHNDFRGGTPDVFYEGFSTMFWVEYKYLKHDPARAFTPSLSELQKKWLRRNYDNGHRPLVVVGCPSGAYVLTEPTVWEKQVQISEYRSVTKPELVRLLRNKAHG